jgi:hypothetical protein
MRSLTKGEASVVRSLLASERVSERERIRRSGIPSRTFEGARQRAYAEGWVFDRYVPDPVRIARPNVTFSLVQPFAERLDDVVERWKNDMRNVLLWRWQETIFGVFLSSDDDSRVGSRQFGPGTLHSAFEVTADTRRPHIPVFFDFEGSWCRSWEISGTLSYPHPIPMRSLEGEPSRRLSQNDRARVAELVRRPFKRGAEPGPLRVSPFYFPRSQRRLLETETVERRVFLDIAKVPAPQARPFERVAFVQGTFLPGCTAPPLFRRLVAMNVFPFLFATDGSRVLLGTLSSSPGSESGNGPRPAILVGLQRHLRSIEIVRESIPSLTVLVNHRYDRLVG